MESKNLNDIVIDDNSDSKKAPAKKYVEHFWHLLFEYFGNINW